MSRRSLRVYFITHHSGLLTGTLIAAREGAPEGTPPAALGQTEADVLAQLEVKLVALCAERDDALAPYLWTEDLTEHVVSVLVHPQTARKGRIVIGKRAVPLRLTYVSCAVDGGHLLVLPRFGWRLLVEDLQMAPEVLRGAVATALLGDRPRSIYDFRREGQEFVRPFLPRALRDGPSSRPAAGAAEPRPVLEAVADDLVERAAAGKLPPLCGAQPELELPPELLRRLRAAHAGNAPPPSLLLVGGPGSGKSTVVHRLARLFLQWQRDGGRRRRVYHTSGERLLAGMVYLGQWQERVQKLVRELAHEGDYLWIDGLSSIIRRQGDGGSIAEALLPAVVSGEVSLILEATAEELERGLRHLPQLEAALWRLPVPEMDAAQVGPLMQQYLQRRGHKVRLHPDGVRRAVSHLQAFERAACFPGKALRFLDWLGEERRGQILYGRGVSQAYARYTGLPLQIIADEAPAGPAEIAAALRAGVVGQDAACAACAQIVARLKAGLNDPGRPCGSLLFLGPTGVGKTELARRLAAYLFGDERRLIRLDMSEYMLYGSAARLLDADSGAHSLAVRVRRQPMSLVLFDEIEKAHPEVFDVLLGVLGEGRLSDSQGRLVDFGMTILVMTSNLGGAGGHGLGLLAGAGDADGAVQHEHERAARAHFRPEFFGRIDQVVPFRRLGLADVERIVDLELAKIARREGLVRRGVVLEVRPAARRRLAEAGFDATYGARPLLRVLEERVVTPVAVRLAADPALRDRRMIFDSDEVLLL